MAAAYPDAAWERLFAPYDPATYQTALAHILPGDAVLDIGAGDLRFARQAACIARRVIAIEIAPDLLSRASSDSPLPANLHLVRANALTWPFPPGIGVGVLLMRHCTHFERYAQKLKQSGARRLITNARWRLGVEAIDLTALPVAYEQLDMGAYACACGSVGFKPGPVQLLTPDMFETAAEVTGCPNCQPGPCSETRGPG